MLWQWWARLFLRKNRTVFKPVVLVTGCASGIGLALAHLLAQHQGYRVVLTARRIREYKHPFSTKKLGGLTDYQFICWI